MLSVEEMEAFRKLVASQGKKGFYYEDLLKHADNQKLTSLGLFEETYCSPASEQFCLLMKPKHGKMKYKFIDEVVYE